MKKKILNTILLITPLLACGSLQSGMTERVEKLEQEMSQIGATNSMDNFGTSFTTASPKGSNHIYIFADPLYWHAKAGGTEYAITVESHGNPLSIQTINNPPIVGSLKGNDFGWDWGLRFGLGYNFDHDCWDLNANYTWYQTNQTAQVRKNTPSFVIATRANDIVWMQGAKSTFNVGYNNVNLELGRSYYISKSISLKPHFGLKSAWLDLKQNVHYALTFHGAPNPFQRTIIKSISKSYSWGIGPRAGLNTEWYLGDGFSIAGNVATALLYGYVRSDVHFKPDGNSNNFGDLISRKLKAKTHRYLPTIQMFLGLIWETFMFERTKHLTLGAGYELEYYWRANQMLYLEDTANRNTFNSRRDHVDSFSEDVMFYGLTLKAKLAF